MKFTDSPRRARLSFRTAKLAIWLASVSLSSISSLAADESAAANKETSAGLVNDWLRRQWPKTAGAWDLGGQFRVRYELKENAGSFPNRDFLEGLDNSNDFLLLRTKVHLGWTPEPWFTAYVQGRDAHSIGDRRAAVETDAFDLHQAYLRFGDPNSEMPLSLEIGRQEMLYGDERYIGISDWSNFGRSFDAAKLRIERPYFWIDVFGGRQVLPRDEHFNEVNDYDWFSGVYASTVWGIPWQTTEVYFLSRNVGAGSPNAIAPGIGGPAPRDIYTVGTRWKSLPGKLRGWDYALEVAGQFGSVNQGGTRLDHQAYAIDLSLGYTWKESFGSPRLAVGYDLGSGDSDPSDSRHETFELLFGTNHRLYGLMDLFGLRNMHIPRVGFSAKPLRDLTVSVEWLAFWLADTSDFLYPESAGPRNQNGYGLNPAFSSYVGSEMDLNVNWRVTGWGQIQSGYGHFFPGEYIRQSAASEERGSEDADWFYFQGTLSF